MTRRRRRSSDRDSKSTCHMKPATYDGTGAWTDFRAHFDACAQLNGWTEEEKGLYLSVSLMGQAQGVWGNLSSKTTDYKELTKHWRIDFRPSTKLNCTEFNFGTDDRSLQKLWQS